MNQNNDSADVQALFKQAMRGIASTVSVVTAGDSDHGHGMTVTAITSVSMNPPALLVCINKNTLLHEIMTRSDRFCVNVLGDEHTTISNAFSGAVPPGERFIDGEWSETAEGIKTLNSAQARIVCTTKMTIPYGTHSIFIGEVADVCNATLPEQSRPLVYRNATYCTSSPLAA